jgi:antitoxin component YwqK of YwqJK toxin-antitoxin module
MVLVRSFSTLTLIAVTACGPARLGPQEIIDRDGVTYELGEEAPFSGVVVEPFADSVEHADGVVMSETTYSLGGREGPKTSWYPNGQVRRLQYFLGDATQGTVREYSEEGVLLLEQDVVDGKAEGVTSTWFGSGAIESVGEYLSGALHGPLTTWYENGQLRVERRYESGHAHGPVREWYDDGSKRVEGTYANGHVHGEYQRWHANGQPAVVATYHRGQSVEITMWDEDGTPLPVEPDLRVESIR